MSTNLVVSLADTITIEKLRKQKKTVRSTSSASIVVAAPTPAFQGRVLAGCQMKFVRERVATPLYVTAVAIAMLGWILALYQGVEWALGA